jgi:AAA domain, putative AbiEii toxin, Type IV TA system
MSTTHVKITNVGQIESADLEFGDLTVLVGPQATGKSICLQLLKLLVDSGSVLAELKRYGIDWNKDVHQFLDIYLGEGMRSIWSKDSQLHFMGKPVNLRKLVSRQKRMTKEAMFFIPAQRVLTIARGWPRPFSEYSAGDPFCVRDFSEKIRQLMETGFGQQESLFPQSRRLKKEIRDLLSETVFSDYGLRVDTHGSQKRFVLQNSGANEANGNGELPFMVWSAGQREFVPLLLGFYWLCPSTKVAQRANLNWVVIEELEMGLHPRAISTAMVLVLELMRRGYRICLSTHSPHVLDVVWALRVFREHAAAPDRLLDVFNLRKSPQTRAMAQAALKKVVRVFLFDPMTRSTRDISNLDPGADDAAESGWGGLTEFSGRVTDIVADVVSRSPSRKNQ